MRIALAQILSGTDPAANLQLVREYTARPPTRARRWWCSRRRPCAGSASRWHRSPSRSTGLGDGVRRIATDAGITVIAGMFTPAGAGRVTNTLIAAGPGAPNRPDTHYDKIHLYDAFGFTESRTVAPGREPVVITVDGIGVGLTVCYDIRFPALYTELARRGAQLIAVCASWGSGPGKLEQWTLLARARALDSMSYVAAAGQADPGRTAARTGRARRPGWAAAWWPRRSAKWSRRPAPGPQLVVADIDLDRVAEARESIAVLRNQSEFAHAR